MRITEPKEIELLKKLLEFYEKDDHRIGLCSAIIYMKMGEAYSEKEYDIVCNILNSLAPLKNHWFTLETNGIMERIKLLEALIEGKDITLFGDPGWYRKMLITD
jgi:hypothetical protein